MVTLKQITALPELESITLVAGVKGIHRTINGVNVVESTDLTEFLRPNELLVTTGIHIKNNVEKLEEMVTSAFHHRAAGIVLNTGPYIPEIPRQILQFGDEHQFPVFQMPWEYRIADFLKIMVQFLMTEQNTQTKTELLLSEMLFHSNPNYESIAKGLSQLGYKTNTDFGIIVCAADHPPINSFAEIIEVEFTKRYRHFLSMVYQNKMIYMVNRSDIQTPQISFSKTAETIRTRINKKTKVKCVIGMGNFYKSLSDVTKSYDEALRVINLSIRHPDSFIYKYSDIGIYKIIMGVQDRNILEAFHEDMLGLLYRYDKLHDTDYIHFLRIFLEEDGHTTNIGRREFIHRNTVLYKIKKIESILDANLHAPFTKTNLSLAFMMEDIMQ